MMVSVKPKPKSKQPPFMLTEIENRVLANPEFDQIISVKSRVAILRATLGSLQVGHRPSNIKESIGDVKSITWMCNIGKRR